MMNTGAVADNCVEDLEDVDAIGELVDKGSSAWPILVPISKQIQAIDRL